MSLTPFNVAINKRFSKKITEPFFCVKIINPIKTAIDKTNNVINTATGYLFCTKAKEIIIKDIIIINRKNLITEKFSIRKLFNLRTKKTIIRKMIAPFDWVEMITINKTNNVNNISVLKITF